MEAAFQCCIFQMIAVTLGYFIKMSSKEIRYIYFAAMEISYISSWVVKYEYVRCMHP